MTACIINAEIQDRQVRNGLVAMEANASQQYKPVIQVIIKWQDQAESTLNRANEALQSMGVSFPT